MPDEREEIAAAVASCLGGEPRRHHRRYRLRAARCHTGGDARRDRARGTRASPRRSGRTRAGERRTRSCRAGSPASSGRRSSSTCRARPAAAATATPCSGRRSLHGLELAAGDRETRTGRREHPRAVSPAPLRAVDPLRAHRLRAPVRLRRCAAVRGRLAGLGGDGLGDGGDGRRAHTRDEPQPPRGRGARRPQPAHRGAGAPVRAR